MTRQIWSDQLAVQASSLITTCQWTSANHTATVGAVNSPFPSKGSIVSLIERMSTSAVNDTLLQWFSTVNDYSIQECITQSSCQPYVQVSQVLHFITPTFALCHKILIVL